MQKRTNPARFGRNPEFNMQRVIHATLHGTLIGPIWSGQVCKMEVTTRLPMRRRGTFLWALEHACKSGDFQHAALDRDSYVVVTLTRTRGRKTIEVTRVLGIEEFPSAKHLVSAD